MSAESSQSATNVLLFDWMGSWMPYDACSRGDLDHGENVAANLTGSQMCESG